MKWLFFLLLIFNLVVFIWGYQIEPSAPAHAYQPKPGVKRLELVGERLEKGEEEPSDPSVNEDEERTLAGEETAETHDQQGAADVAKENDVVPPAPVSSTEFIGTLGEEADRRPSLALEKGVAEDTSPVNDSMLRAASAVAEVFSQPHATPEAEEGVAEPAVQTPPKVEEPVATVCVSAGPVQNQADVSPIEALLAKHKIDAKLRTEMIAAEGSGYWVVIPPLPTKEKAIEEEKKLREAGVEDLWRFTKGSMANAISLGLFSKRPLSEKYADKIRAKGFQAEVRPRKIAKTFFWLDFGLPSAGASEEALRQEILSIDSALRLEQRACSAR
ncbi:MAG TPA: hypothetical protein EYH03_01825 [Chromatiales bacterium]|nr:hypothetical protein [Chromatiales bacterium]